MKINRFEEPVILTIKNTQVSEILLCHKDTLSLNLSLFLALLYKYLQCITSPFGFNDLFVAGWRQRPSKLCILEYIRVC